ncbi:ferritin [archaeon]|jgi:ferritin|nr:ferritin [archaeon]MBT4023190.1 ferritin [archaeon]MBT4272396.1 ferritin [archaeon]MBT4460695.1 ferritin [archaeon]MBT4859127.1 ferritin [archaeon]
MKISKKMQDAINAQINEEFASSYIYLSMAAYFESENLSGMATWMKLQAEEEIEHAMKFFNYVFERGGDVKLTAIKEPKDKWESPLNAFEEAYAHEQFITKKIHALADVADELDDLATESFLKWFIDEQVEEENNALTIVEKLKIMGDSKGSLLMYDRVLGKRGQK